ncbi:MAG: hypothetical protein ABEJ44_06600 [Halanaeroarchaeum sp.]
MAQTLLGGDAREQLVSTCRTSIGDSLRSLTYFTRTDYEQLYLRGDLEQDADLSTFIGHEWRDYEQTQDSYGNSELGEYRYTIRTFENGFLLRVTTTNEGVFLTTDGLTIQQFDKVATAVRRTLDTWRD